MWVRGIVRRADPAGKDWDAYHGQLKGILFEEGLGGADFAWAKRDKVLAVAGAVRDEKYTTRIAQIGFRVLAERAPDAFVALAKAGFEALPDPEIAAADVWTPHAPGGGLFATRDQALALVGAPRRLDRALGRGVNVVIFDYGIEHAWLYAEQKRLGVAATGVFGGWPRYQRHANGGRSWFRPGDRPPGGLTHGQMIARNILAIAPAATIWDVPLLPDTAFGPPGIAMAEAIFWHVVADWQHGVQADRGATAADGTTPWPLREIDSTKPLILVNAWGALDPIRFDPFFAADPSPKALKDGPYWNNPDHYFIDDMRRLSTKGIDVVFAAGNCGTPGGSPRCGDTMTGPGRSIHGVNAHAGVLTVGAVRCDGLAIGGSAQGPGALLTTDPAFQHKPDLCAPSHFHETEGDGLVNTGTSAACGIAAGVLAALRSLELPGQHLRPAAMRQLLRDTAQGSGAWDPRLGHGVIRFDKARDRLAATPAAPPAPPAAAAPPGPR